MLNKRQEFNEQVCEKGDGAYRNGNEPAYRVQTPLDHPDRLAAESEEKNLQDNDRNENGEEIEAFVDVHKDVQSVIDDATVQEIEKGEEDEGVEDIGVMHGILVIVVFAFIPVIGPAAHYKLVRAGLQLSLADGIYQKVLPLED